MNGWDGVLVAVLIAWLVGLTTVTFHDHWHTSPQTPHGHTTTMKELITITTDLDVEEEGHEASVQDSLTIENASVDVQDVSFVEEEELHTIHIVVEQESETTALVTRAIRVVSGAATLAQGGIVSVRLVAHDMVECDRADLTMEASWLGLPVALTRVELVRNAEKQDGSDSRRMGTAWTTTLRLPPLPRYPMNPFVPWKLGNSSSTLLVPSDEQHTFHLEIEAVQWVMTHLPIPSVLIQIGGYTDASLALAQALASGCQLLPFPSELYIVVTGDVWDAIPRFKEGLRDVETNVSVSTEEAFSAEQTLPWSLVAVINPPTESNDVLQRYWGWMERRLENGGVVLVVADEPSREPALLLTRSMVQHGGYEHVERTLKKDQWLLIMLQRKPRDMMMLSPLVLRMERSRNGTNKQELTIPMPRRPWEEQHIPTSFSVVVPCHNCASTILATLDSIVVSISGFDALVESHQSSYFVDGIVTKEIILVDDRSTDGSASRVLEYATRNPLLRAILRIVNIPLHESTKTAAGSRNVGAKNARGEVLFFCDADDRYLPHHINVTMHILAMYDCASVSTEIVVEEGVIHEDWKIPISETIPSTLGLWTWVFNLIGGFPSLERGEDAVFRTLLFTHFKECHVNNSTVEFTRHAGSSFDRQLVKFQHPIADRDVFEEGDWEIRERGTALLYEMQASVRARWSDTMNQQRRKRCNEV